MCWAVPGKVISVEGLLAKVDFDGNVKEVILALDDVEPGDMVMVHAGVAITKMSPEEWEKEQELLMELLEGKI